MLGLRTHPMFAISALVTLGCVMQEASSAQLAVSPVQKVLILLKELHVKVVKDGEAELKAYNDYVDWCENGAKDKEYEIKDAESSIEGLTATIDKAEADITTMTSKVDDLGASIAANEADLKEATGIREKEHKEFTAMEEELADTVDTLERAINVLSRKMSGSALLQAKVSKGDMQKLLSTLSEIVDAAALSLKDKQKLLGLVQSTEDERDEEDSLGAPAPEAYKSRSESIVDVLEDLKQKAVEELEEARREEASARHNFELMKQSIEDQLKVDTQSLAESKSVKHDSTVTKSNAEGEMTVTKQDLEDAETVLKNMKRDCMNKANDHEASVQSRAEELKALEGAMAAIQDMTADAGALTYNTTSFLQLDDHISQSKGSFLQMREKLANFEVVNVVRKLAREQKSAQLAQLAGRISALIRAGANSGDDPFAKVKTLITNMIDQLQKEAGQEATHKAYCDKEMADTKQKMDELKYDIEKHGSQIDTAKARSASLKDEVSTLSGEIAQITKAMGEAQALRTEEHSVYVQSKSDLEKGLEGVRTAVKLLRDYYANEGATSFIQQPEDPELHSASSGSSIGIIGMLEVVESDMGKALANVEMDEETAATAYQRFAMDNRVSKQIKEKDVEYKTKEATTLDKQVAELSSDRDSLQTELDAVLDYSSNIRGMCELKPETYEERTARREAEISGLRDALQILDSEEVFIQQNQRRAAFLQKHQFS